MSEQILNQILDELKSLNTRVDSMDSRLDSMDSRLDNMDSRFDGVDSRLDDMDSKFNEMGSRLDGMDSRFNEMGSRLDGMDSRFNEMGSRFDRLEADVKDIKEHTKDIPAIKQAVLENLALTKQVESAQASLERKVTSELTTHGHSIDILNRRQLKFEAELESLKKSLS
jgi:chromosome segregation ATPase